MSEARQRRLAHFSSDIFCSGPANLSRSVCSSPKTGSRYNAADTSHTRTASTHAKNRNSEDFLSVFPSRYSKADQRPAYDGFGQRVGLKRHSSTSAIRLNQSLDLGREEVQSDVRKTDHLYSNLFGREFVHPSGHDSVSRRLSDDYQPTQRGVEQAPVSPAEFKQQMLRSSFEAPYRPRESPAPSPKTRSPQLSPSQIKQKHLYSNVRRPSRDPAVESFVITGLHPHDNEDSIRRLCNGVHVVKIKPEMDDIKGECMGSATIMIRHNPNSTTVKRFARNMVSVGYQVREADKPAQKRNGPVRARSPLKTSEGPRQNKMRFLENSGDHYGSSKGIGRYAKATRDQSVDTSINYDRTSDQNLATWNKNSRHLQSRAGSVGSNSGRNSWASFTGSSHSYMKPTYSSYRKQCE